MIAQRIHHRRAPVRRLVALCMLALFAGAAQGQIALDPGASAYEQLQSLSEQAGSIQVGQPGNELVDTFVRQRFERIVAEENDPARQARAEAALAEAREAEDRVSALRTEQVTSGGGTGQYASPLWENLLFERPTTIFFIIAGIAAVMLLCGKFQKRMALLATGVFAAVLAIAAPIVSVMVETKNEALTREAAQAAPGEATQMTAAAYAARIKGASIDALRADIKAGEALAGMWQTGRMTYPTAAFIPGEAELRFGDAWLRLYQIAPNLVEPANIPGGQWDGRVVYAGRASAEDLDGVNIADAAAIIEYDTANDWIELVQLGAAMIIVVQPPDDQTMAFTHGAQKSTLSLLSVPRFFATRADLDRLFGEGWDDRDTDFDQAVRINQTSQGRWERRMVAADWLFIPGAAQVTPDATLSDDAARQIVHVQAFKDGGSFVPALSPGATGLGNIVAAMKLVDDLRADPPTRPVLLSIVNDHGNALHGEQVFGYYAFAAPEKVEAVLAWVQRQLDQERYFANYYNADPIEDQGLIEEMRGLTVWVGNQQLKVKDPINDRLTYLRNTLREERIRLQYELENLTLTAEEEARRDRRIVEVQDEVSRFNELMGLFNQFSMQTDPSMLSESQREALRGYFDEVSEEARVAAERLELIRAQMMANLELRRRLLAVTAPELGEDTADALAANDSASTADVFAARHPAVAAGALIALDLSYGSDEAGLFYFGHRRTGEGATLEEYARQRTTRLAQYCLRLTTEWAERTGERNILTDTVRNVGGIHWTGHLGGRFAFASRVGHQFALPALTLTAVRDMRPRAYTPDDTVAHLDPQRVELHTSFARQFVRELANSEELGKQRQTISDPDPFVADVHVRRTDKFSTTTPKTKLPYALITAYNPNELLPNNAPMLGQVRPMPTFMADVRGAAMVYGAALRSSSLQVYRYDDRYTRLTQALDHGDGEIKFKSALPADVNTSFPGKASIVVTFNVHKLDIVGLTSPTGMEALAAVQLIDANSEAAPKQYSGSGVTVLPSKTVPLSQDTTATVMLEGESRFKLKGSLLAINATEDEPQGIGFPINSEPLYDLKQRSVRDMWMLTEARLNDLEGKGVANPTARELHDEARKQIDRALQHQQAGRNSQRRIATDKAAGLEFKAYSRALGTINDLIRAVAIFMALVIPFCFFVTKLISPFTDITKQLTLFVVVFVVMVFGLRFVHPAFAIAKTPEVVILAFVIFGLGMFVSMVLIGRFNATMIQFVEQTQQTETVDAPQGRLASVAFMVGVNNMKRRRIRTTLTCATIVLVTFTMLSVISVGQDVAPTRVRTTGESPYDGFVFTKSGMGVINDVPLQRMRARFAENAETLVRAWAQRQGTYGEYLGYELAMTEPIPGAQMSTVTAKVLVGLEKAEDGFIGPMPLTAGSKWFSSDDAREIVISEKMAALMGITPQNFRGRQITVMGEPLTLVGLVDDERMEAMRDLADLRLLPMLIKPSKDHAVEAGQVIQALGAGDDSGSGGGGDLPGTEAARASDVAFIPIGFSRTLGESYFRTLSVKFNAPDQDDLSAASLAWHAATEYINDQQARLFIGLTDTAPAIELARLRAQDEDVTDPAAISAMADKMRAVDRGQYTLQSSSSTQVGGLLKVVIPIILAATIILNTMLGSVMERRREVGIYNAIGLNPGHVMMFFLAESLVFGMVGSVAGYLIGQILSLVIHYTNLIELNLNYSSMSVMVVIFLTIAVVLLSTVYPALMAARAAVPSGQRRWSLPQPEGDQIHINFPFSYDPKRVLGVCAYLREYMNQNSEASTGKFLAYLGPVGRVPAEVDTSGVDNPPPDVDQAYAMVFDIAPAPFDLGVNQTMEVYAYYEPRIKAHMLSVHLTRKAGDAGSWVVVNQPFLEALRKRLLGWRSQPTSTHDSFFQRGQALFADAPPLPVAESKEAAG